jgi:hypothetical protein
MPSKPRNVRREGNQGVGNGLVVTGLGRLPDRSHPQSVAALGDDYPGHVAKRVDVVGVAKLLVEARGCALLDPRPIPGDARGHQRLSVDDLLAAGNQTTLLAKRSRRRPEQGFLDERIPGFLSQRSDPPKLRRGREQLRGGRRIGWWDQHRDPDRNPGRHWNWRLRSGG